MPFSSSNFAPLHDGSQQVWMSHGDEAVKLPDGFTCVGKSDAGAVVVRNTRRR